MISTVRDTVCKLSNLFVVLSKSRNSCSDLTKVCSCPRILALQTNLVTGIHHLRKDRPKRAITYFESFGASCDSNSDLLLKNLEGLFTLGVLTCNLKMKGLVQLNLIPFPDVTSWILVATIQEYITCK